eukprot:scpid76289/ scgid18490/ B-cell lymphoma 3 protein; Proto-oncogene BCL3
MEGDPDSGSLEIVAEQVQVTDEPMETISTDSLDNRRPNTPAGKHSPEPNSEDVPPGPGKRKRDSSASEDGRNMRTKVHDVAGKSVEPVDISASKSPIAGSTDGPMAGSNQKSDDVVTSSTSSTETDADAAAASDKAAAAASTGSQDFQLDRESLVFAAECHMAVLQDEDGDTPLHLAVVQANKHLVHHLVYLISRSSRHVDIANTLRQTPLHLAAITGQADLIRLLLANNASCNLPDRMGRTGLHLVAERNYDDCCTALLEARDVDFEMRNFDGYSPVHLAVFNNSYAVLQKLLDSGATINPRDGKSGRTPLHHAAEAGNGAMVQFLIGHFADIDATTYAGNTPLHSAAGRGHEHIVSVLVTAGADTRLQNTEGDVAADVARFRNAFRAPASQSTTTTTTTA